MKYNSDSIYPILSDRMEKSLVDLSNIINFRFCWVDIRLIYQCQTPQALDIPIVCRWLELNVIFLFRKCTLPSIEALLGRMVTAPSATSSWSWMGEFLAPQLSEPTNRKWPVRLDFFAACNTRLKEDRLYFSTHLLFHSSARGQVWLSYRSLDNYIKVSLCTLCHLVDFHSLMWHAAQLDSLDVILVGKDDDPTSIRGLHHSLDDLIKLPWSGLSRDLYGLCNTQPP